MADNSDILKRLEEDQQRKQEFIGDLKRQIREDEIKRMRKQEEDFELNLQNDNILINDEMRGAEANARQTNYKNRLINQMNENDDKRNGENQQREMEDALFRRKMREALE